MSGFEQNALAHRIHPTYPRFYSVLCTLEINPSNFSVVTMERTLHGWLVRYRTHPCFSCPITYTAGDPTPTAGPPTSHCVDDPLPQKCHPCNSRSSTMDAPISSTTSSSSLTEGTPTPFVHSRFDYGPFQYRREPVPSDETVMHSAHYCRVAAPHESYNSWLLSHLTRRDVF